MLYWVVYVYFNALSNTQRSMREREEESIIFVRKITN